jgi:DNA-binding MarR family transcriptional regulator
MIGQEALSGDLIIRSGFLTNFLMDDPTRELPLPAAIGVVKDAIVDELHARLRAQGFLQVRPAHGCVFGNIGESGSRLTELAERAGLTKQSVGEAVADLERLGYVERAPDPEDGRAKIIRLTPRGAEALAAARGIFADIEARLSAAIGEERFAEFRAVLGELYALTRATEPAARAAA